MSECLRRSKPGRQVARGMAQPSCWCIPSARLNTTHDSRENLSGLCRGKSHCLRRGCLPDNIQCKLNVPGLRYHCIQISGIAEGSVLIQQLGLFTALKRQGWRKVGVIQDVEKLRP